MRRGLTLIELLLAVALLAGVASAIVPLTRVALGGMRQIDQDLHWQRSADMTLNEIGLVLLRRDRQEARAGPVIVDEHTLRVRLAGGSRATLTLSGDRLTIEERGQESRVLLGELDSVEFSIDEETGLLTIRLTSTHELSIERSWDIGS